MDEPACCPKQAYVFRRQIGATSTAPDFVLHESLPVIVEDELEDQALESPSKISWVVSREIRC